MVRSKEEFLGDCDPAEREQFSRLFDDTATLAKELGDERPDAEAEFAEPLDVPLRLRWVFNDRKGASLRLQHPKLRSAPVTLLWAHPSRNHDRQVRANCLYIHREALKDGGVKETDVARFGQDLTRADFKDAGTMTWVTSGDLSVVYRHRANRELLRAAICTLIRAIDGY